MNCDECGVTVSATGFLGGTIVCTDCARSTPEYKEACKK